MKDEKIRSKANQQQWILPPEWVNDAIWAWNAPPYFTGSVTGGDSPFIQPAEFFGIPDFPSESSEPVPVQSLRIGRLFEFYTSEVLHAILHPEPVYTGIQVMKKKDTAGELDFLFKWKGEWIHLEIAIKFYASATGSEKWSDWIGPSMRDSLDKKMDKLLSRQLLLTEKPETRDAIFSITGGEPVQSMAWVTGWLFVHIKYLGGKDVPLPENGNPAVMIGYWMHSGERPEWLLHAKSFRILNRPNWLTGRLPGFSESFEGYDDWIKRIKSRLHADLYPAELTEIETSDGKTIRLFVFHPVWPGN